MLDSFSEELRKVCVSDFLVPIAVVASDATVRMKPLIYPEPFALQMAGREKRPLGNLSPGLHTDVGRTELSPEMCAASRMQWGNVTA